MKTIGLIGGMSWESTANYYQEINLGVKARLGGLHSAKLVMISVDFAEVEQLQQANNWSAAADLLIRAGKSAEAAGAQGLIICTNTMHKVAEQVQANVTIPILHIADGTADELLHDGIATVGLLGTRFTMEQDFYKQRLKQHGIETLIPSEEQRSMVHSVIYQELCLGKIEPSSKQYYLDVIRDLAANGAESVILGCTEIGLLVQQADTPVRLYDTTKIHVGAALDFILPQD